jgi:hypothetical protein
MLAASTSAKENMQSVLEDRKDDRVVKQTVEQSKLISQRKGERGELQDDQNKDEDFLTSILK